MEPHREEQKPVERPSSEKQKRFRIVKLEERIAPKRGTTGKGTCVGCTTGPGGGLQH